MATINQLVKQSDAPKQDLVASMFEAQLDQYIKAIGGEKQAIQFMRQAISLCKVNPKLLDCDRNSLLAEIMSAAELKLSLNSRLGQAYLVPFKNNATLIVGYRGYIDLFYRHELSKAYMQSVFIETIDLVSRLVLIEELSTFLVSMADRWGKAPA